MKQSIRKLKKLGFLAFIVTISILSSFLDDSRVKAAPLAAISDTLDTTKANVSTGHTFRFSFGSNGLTGGQSITIDFPAGFDAYRISYYTTHLTYGPTTGNENSVNFGSSPSGTTWGVSSATSRIVLTSGSNGIPTNNKVIITFQKSAGITNPSIPGNYVIAITAGNNTGNAGVYITEDLVSINAAVDPELYFTISNTSTGFGSFVGTNIRYATGDLNGSNTIPNNGDPTTITASTNASSGILFSIYDQGNGTGGLWSSSVSDLIPAAPSSQITNSSKLYGVYGRNAAGLTINDGFDNNGVNDLAISNISQPFASSSSVVSSGSVDITLVAAINTFTKAGTYNDLVTILCTGRY